MSSVPKRSFVSRGELLCSLVKKTFEVDDKIQQENEPVEVKKRKVYEEKNKESVIAANNQPSLVLDFNDLGLTISNNLIVSPHEEMFTNEEIVNYEPDLNNVGLVDNFIIPINVLIEETSTKGICLTQDGINSNVFNEEVIEHIDILNEECIVDVVREDIAIQNLMAEDVINNNDDRSSGEREEVVEHIDILNEECIVDVVREDIAIQNTMAEDVIDINDDGSSGEREEVESECELNRSKGRPKKGRKQKYPGQTRALRKEKTNSNQPYFSARGKEVEIKVFKNYFCLCLNQCHNKVSVEVREKEFYKYWQLGSYTTQTTYIGLLVSETPVKRHYSKNGTSRQFSRIYKIDNIPVCREMFVHTFGISPKRISSALTKIRTGSIPDKRGVTGGKNKLSDVVTKHVINHIKKIPKYKSHYCRGKTDREYLPSHMTLQVMYDLYKIDLDCPVSFSKYKEVFYSFFNLRRKKYHKDTCNTCDSLKVKIENETRQDVKATLINTREEHMVNQEMCRTVMKNDINQAKEDEHIETLTFDLEKTLSMPKIPTNIIYYKRQLSLYNLGIHSAKLNQGFCFVWVEGEAGRGAQEIGFCLKKYFSKYLDTKVTHVNLWSDSCGGQNRNIKITLMLHKLLASYPNLQSVSIKFLTPGHSYLPNDTDFSFIESALKMQQRMYTVDDYIRLMQTCKKKKPLIVEKMAREDFVSTSFLEKGVTNRKKDVKGNNINWLKIREIAIFKAKPFILNTKTSMEFVTVYQEIDINKRKKGRPMGLNLFNQELESLWPKGKPISMPKLNDLRSIMHLIPSDAKSYYNSLTGDKNITDDIDSFNVEHLDFEIETDENLL